MLISLIILIVIILCSLTLLEFRKLIISKKGVLFRKEMSSVQETLMRKERGWTKQQDQAWKWDARSLWVINKASKEFKRLLWRKKNTLQMIFSRDLNSEGWFWLTTKMQLAGKQVITWKTWINHVIRLSKLLLLFKILSYLRILIQTLEPRQDNFLEQLWAHLVGSIQGWKLALISRKT